MKKLLASFATITVFLASTSTAMAAPWFPAENQLTPNDKFVAYYPDGRHAIAGFDNDQFFGRDLVMRRGESGQFQQWFQGTNPNGDYVAIHSVWNLAHAGKCPNTWISIPNAYPQWGYYLVPNATYCVHNNFYQGTN